MKVDKLVVGLYQENCYFLTNNNDLIIIDPGDEFDKINNKIISDKLNLRAILITHAHFDHIGALKELINLYHVPVYYNNINNEISYEKLINVDEKDYEISKFYFKIIKTPGHRNDLVTYYFYKENIMFTGDFLFKESIGRLDLEYANEDEMITSIEKINKYPDNTVIYPGHGDKTILKEEKENNYYFKMIDFDVN